MTQIYPNPSPSGGTPEGTAVLSTGEAGAVKFLREDGDGTSSWQVPAVTEGVGESTGVLTGGVLSTGAGAAEYSISDGTAQIIDSDGTKTAISWTGKTNITPTNLATNLISFVGINSSGVVVEQTTRFTNTQSRTIVILGVAVHVNNSTVDAVNNEQNISFNTGSQLNDLTESLGLFNSSGNVLSANGANLNLNKSAGAIYGSGVNYASDIDNPNLVTTGALTGLSFQYRYSDGTNGATGIAFDPDNLDDGAGGLTAIGNNKWSIQRAYSFTSNNVKLQRGVSEYSSESLAIAGITTEAFITEPSIAANGVLRGYIVSKKGSTDLSNASSATFISAPRFQSSTGGIGSLAETLQNVYDNSTSPEILTDATLGALSVKRGSAADTDDVFEAINGSDVQTFSVTGAGVIDGTDITMGGTASTGTGGVVRETSPTLVTPALGTPSAAVLTNATGLPGTSVINTPAGDIVAVTVQAAIDELDTEKLSLSDPALADNFDFIMPVTGGSALAAQFTAATFEYLDVADNADMSMGNIDFSTAGSFYLDSHVVAGERVIIIKGDASVSNAYEYIVRIHGDDGGANANKIRVDINNGATTGTVFGPVIVINQWYFFTMVHDATANTITLQLNNDPAEIYSTSYSSGSQDTANATAIGGYGPTLAAGYWDGRLSQIGVWKKTLSAAEGTELFNGGAGVAHTNLSAGLLTSLQAYYDLDEVSGSRIDSENAYNMTDNATVTSGPGPAASSGVQYVKAESVDSATIDPATDFILFGDTDDSGETRKTLADGIVTATNVTTAGALMDSELASIADVKALDQSVISGATPTFTGTNISGTAASLTAGNVTTNANSTGDVTSVGNTTTIAPKAVDVAMLADGTDGELITWSATGVAATVAVGTATEVLTSNGVGVAPTFQAVAGGGDALTANPLSQFAATTSAQLAGVLSDETGTGLAVFGTSPTLITPALGTPSALVATNATGTAASLTAGNVTTNANLTGEVTSVGNTASLGSFTSLALKTALTNETGSGAAVFATSPVLVTPALGTPASGVMTNVTGTAASLTAGNVTTNANSTGDVTSVGNTTTIAAKAVDVAMLADGTDGELITWSATGVAATVAVGTATEVLTSNGVGVAPTFQAAAGGGGGTVQGTDGTYDIEATLDGATDGSARGENSVDLCTQRSVAAYVTAGTNSGAVAGESIGGLGTHTFYGAGNLNHTNSGTCCAIFGKNNYSNSGHNSFISGGGTYGNYSNSGARAVISGENNHTNSGSYATLSGYGNHSNTGNYSVISGSGSYSNTGTNCLITGSGHYSNSGDKCLISGSSNYGCSGNNSAILGSNNHTNSGLGAIIGGNGNNTNTGDYALIGGANNSSNSGTHALIGGQNNSGNSGTHCSISGKYNATNTGNFCSISGAYVDSNNLDYARIHGGGTTAYRIIDLVPWATTANTTPKAMTLGGAVEGAAGSMIIPINTAWAFTADIVAVDATNSFANAAKFSFDGLVLNDAGTVTVSSGTLGTDATQGTFTGSVACSADTTNDALRIMVTGISTDTIRWAGRVQLTQVQ